MNSVLTKQLLTSISKHAIISHSERKKMFHQMFFRLLRKTYMFWYFGIGILGGLASSFFPLQWIFVWFILYSAICAGMDEAIFGWDKKMSHRLPWIIIPLFGMWLLSRSKYGWSPPDPLLDNLPLF